MPEHTITLFLKDNNKISKAIKVSNDTSYDELLKIASSKFRSKIFTILSNDGCIYDPQMIKSGLKLYCSTKIINGNQFIFVPEKTIPVNIVAVNSYICDESIKQLQSLQKLEDVTDIFGMPDLHVGKGCPIGAVTLTSKTIYPHLIGEDIGCGMLFLKTSLPEDLVGKKLTKIASHLDLEGPYNNTSLEFIDVTKFSNYENEKAFLDDVGNYFYNQLGTIGAGNHFLELQKIDKIFDANFAEQYGMQQDYLYLTIHSGSRGIGESVLNIFEKNHCSDDYKNGHSDALLWAKCNRRNIAKRFSEQVNGCHLEPIVDMFHNYYEEITVDRVQYTVHRKGASATNNELIIIPGSRGSKTYVVKPIKNDITHGFSVSHGAGRKIARTKMYDIINDASVDDKQIKIFGSEIENIVICEDHHLLYEEACCAYKDIDIVIDDLVKLGLVVVIASLSPVLTYKYRSAR